MESLDFKAFALQYGSLCCQECDFRNPTKTSSDMSLCGSHDRPMNDDDLSGTPGYIAKHLDWRNHTHA